MKLKIWILLLLGGLILVWGCGGTGEIEQVTPPQQLAGYADDYKFVGVEWINRDDWSSNDGTTRHYFSVSYNYWVRDKAYDFADKIDSSSVEGQDYWSQYQTYHPGGRFVEDYGSYLWAGTSCQGLVYRSAIKAGYSIDEECLNNVNPWLNEGTAMPWSSVQEGDVVLMDFDNDLTTYDHVGVIWMKAVADSTYDEIVSAMGLYSSPFDYKAGLHTLEQYNDILPIDEIPYEPPAGGWRVYHVKYIRLTQ